MEIVGWSAFTCCSAIGFRIARYASEIGDFGQSGFRNDGVCVADKETKASAGPHPPAIWGSRCTSLSAEIGSSQAS